MKRDISVEVLLDAKPRLGEGPLWDAATGWLYFIDCLGDRVFRCREDGREFATFEVPSHIGSMCLAGDDAALVALRDGFHHLDLATHECRALVDPEPELAGNRLNDGKCDRRGRFLCGSMDMAETSPTGMLWSLDTDGRVIRLDEGIICSNGPCFSPDGCTLYFADSFRGRIYAYDYDPDTGAATNRRVFVEPVMQAGGAPDGATVDAEGYVWSALVFDGRIVRYAPDGSFDREIPMPVLKCTSLCFGGEALDTLFVTSMAHPPLPRYPGDGPKRGATFAVYGLGVTGIAEARFGGAIEHWPTAPTEEAT